MSIKHLLSVLLSMFLLSGCGYNQIQINDEQINASLVGGAQPIQAPCRSDPPISCRWYRDMPPMRRKS
jgi:hypothetical protein